MQTKRFLRNVTVTFGLAGLALCQSTLVTTTSSANYRTIVAPDSIVSAWGSGLSAGTITANATSVDGQLVSLPLSLGPVSLSITDAHNRAYQPGLYMVSPGQINYVVPAEVPIGIAKLSVNGSILGLGGSILVSNVAPSLYTADASGNGVPVGSALRVTAANVVAYDGLFQNGTSTFVPKPINLTQSTTDNVYLILYGTGFRLHSLNPVVATIGGVKVPVLYAGAQSQYPGFDQLNLGPLPQTLVGKNVTDLVVTVDGVPSNTVQVSIQ